MYMQAILIFTCLDGADQCSTNDNDVNGISLKTSYKPLPGEQFFTHLIQFTETTQECPFDAFIPLSGNYRAHGLSLHTDCPLLSLGELIFPDMSHTMQLIGSNPDCFPHDSLGFTDVALVIQSKLKSDRLPLGNFITLQRSNDEHDMTTAFGQNKEDRFVAILHSVKVTLFDGILETNARIENNVLDISGNINIFQFPAQVHITAPINFSDWNDLDFTAEGELLPGKDSFVESLSNAVKRKVIQLATSGNSRLVVAQMSLQQATDRLNDVERRHNATVCEVEQARERNITAALAVETAQNRQAEKQEIFNSSQSELNVLEDMLNRLCTEQFCEDICMPGSTCRNCSRPTFIMQTSRCPATVKERRNIRVPPFFVKRTTWRFVGVCRLENNLVCFEEKCPVGTNPEICYGKCVPLESLLPVYNWRMVEVDVLTYVNCNVTLFNSTIPDTCCENVTCAVFAPNASCVSGNAFCRSARQNATERAQGVREETRKLYQDLQEARRNLAVARTAAVTANLELKIRELKRDQIEMTMERIGDATNRARVVYDDTLEMIEPLLRLGRQSDGDFQTVFNVISISFNTGFTTQSPKALALNITFEKKIRINNEKYTDTYVYIKELGRENFEVIGDRIVKLAFIKRNTLLQTRIVRQLTEDTMRQIFATRCAHLSNTQLFFTEIRSKLQEVQDSIDASHESMEKSQTTLTGFDPSMVVDISVLETEFNLTLNNQGPHEDEEVNAYLDLIRSYEDFSAEGLRSLEETIFFEWQASMEYLYSESGSVGEVSCDGFADCLQTSLDELQNLVSLTPENELNEQFVSLVEGLPRAGEMLLELALSTNISITEALDRTSPIIEITYAFATDNYWCNVPPVMITEPPAEVNVSLGGIVRLSCEAESDISVTYEWRKDGNVIPQFNTNELILDSIQRLDSGNYTCFANNPVGSAESITTSVTVYELPKFYLLPQSVVTYSGNDNGAWFACNASARPYPGWRWFYRTSDNGEWSLIEGEDTNELLILNPQDKDAGFYTCETFNYHGTIRAEAVTLTLLPFTVSQHRFPLQFSIFINSSDDVQSCSLEDLYDSAHDLISEAVGVDTSIIEDFNITEVDVNNHDVAFSLLSDNVTTHYLHLMTFSEIANMALPQAASVRKGVQSVTEYLSDENARYSCQGVEFSIVPSSLIVGKLTYVCPLGQRLNSDFLLCCKLV